jgi:PEP-CTERM motif
MKIAKLVERFAMGLALRNLSIKAFFVQMRQLPLIRSTLLPGAILLSILAMWAVQASAAPFVLSQGAFGSPIIDFGLVETFAPINGQTINGVTFGFTIGGNPSTDAVIDSGPGNTNNITVANIEGNTLGILSLIFPHLEVGFGFGYALAILGGGVTNATSVELFDASNVSLGSLSFNGVADPLFVGGFAGIGNLTPFKSAQVTFNSAATTRFAFDNVRVNAAVPEPATFILVGLGLAALGFSSRRKKV